MNRLHQGSLFDDDDSMDSTSSSERSTQAQVPARKMFIPADEQRLVIRASAGTGKTFQLANRFLTLLRSSISDKILASTFTRKAAGEIIDRILLRVAKAAIDPKEFEGLAQFVGSPALTKPECQRIVRDLTQNLHRLRISTLDGFFARLAGSFALELRLPPGWRLIDEIEADHLQALAIDQVLREGDVQEMKDLMHQLDKGSIRRSVHQLISQHISSFHEIYLRSDKQAWQQFGKITLPTTEKFDVAVEELAALEISDKRMAKARNEDLQRLADEDWSALYNKGLLSKVLRDGKYYRKEIPDPVQDCYRQLEKLIRAKWLMPWAEQTSATWELLQKYDQHYEQLKRETSALRFDDVTRQLASTMGNRSPQEFAHRLDGEIAHVLLDEFQDTSVSQWNVIRPFAEETTNDAEKSFFCVGDGKQAIYSWRGGEATIFDTIVSQLSGVSEQPLNKSFRSSPVVIEAVNLIFKGIVNHDGFDDEFKAVQQWSNAFPIHETARQELPGYFRLCTSPIPAGMEPGSRDLRWLNNEANRYTAELIAEQLQQHPTGSIGVLTRSNAKIGELIFELNRLGIDASEEGGNPLTDSAGVQLLLALFQLVDHPGDAIARFHVCHSPLQEILKLPAALNDEQANKLALTLRRSLINQGYGVVVHRLVKQLAPHCSRRELRRLTQMAALADDFDIISQNLRTNEFIEFVEKQRVQEPTDSRVRVMTIHQSKGLQFDTVIYAECDNALSLTPSYIWAAPGPGESPNAVALYRSKEFYDLFPAELKRAFDQTTEKQIVEALCLLYVALTRAVHSLHVVCLPRIAKGEEKKLPKTAAGLIRAAVAPTATLTSQTTLFELGDPNWFASIHKEETVSESGAKPRQLKIAFKKSARTRNLPRVSPSQKDEGTRIRLETVLPVGDSVAMLRGSLFHAWLEQITWLEDSMLDHDRMRFIANQLGCPGEKTEKWAKEFSAALKRPTLHNFLYREQYLAATGDLFSQELMAHLVDGRYHLQVENERGFAIYRQGKLISGSIDRLVTIRDDEKVLAADVIDFKTDMLPANDMTAINERVDHYRNQMHQYRLAVNQFYDLPKENISTRLFLLHFGRVIKVEGD